jgi:hypothetical protein
MWNAMERSEMRTKFWPKDLKTGDHSEDLDVDGRIILESIFGKLGGKVWTVCIWIRTETGGGLLWTRYELPGSMKGEEFLTSWLNIRFWRRTMHRSQFLNYFFWLYRLQIMSTFIKALFTSSTPRAGFNPVRTPRITELLPTSENRCCRRQHPPKTQRHEYEFCEHDRTRNTLTAGSLHSLVRTSIIKCNPT